VTEPDLRAVDELCRLVLAARRLGCRVHVTSLDAELCRLLVLAGVDAVVSDGGRSRPRHCRGALRPPTPPMNRPVR
jgi:glycerophosphoryl diester phosphodiesterase